MWSSLLLLSSLLVVNIRGTGPNTFLLFNLSTNEVCSSSVPAITMWMEFAIANSSCFTFSSASTANTQQMHTIPFQIAEDDSVMFYWIDIHPNASCMITVNASLEYDLFREPLPLCPQKHDGYVVSSAGTILNQTISYSPLNSSVCNDRVISIPSSCGGRLSTSETTNSSTAILSNFATQSSVVYSTTMMPTSIHSSFIHSTTIVHSSISLATTLIAGPTNIPQNNSYGVRVELEVVTYVGVSLSLVGLIIAILTLLIVKKLRKRDSSKFHIQLCLSLCFVLIIFVTGISRTSVRPICISIGALIHYFTLVFWMWMGAEAVLMFKKIVIVFTNITWRYLLIVSIVCWSMPLIPVLILSGIDYNFYITLHMDSGFCFIGEAIPFFVAFLCPIFLITLFNSIMYILVIRSTFKSAIQRKKQMSMSDSPLSISEVLKMIMSFTVSEVLKMVVYFTAMIILFGLTLISAAFTLISESGISFRVQFVFAFFVALQGFFMFFSFILLNTEYRSQWGAIFCPSQKNTVSTTPKAHSTTSHVNRAVSAIQNATIDNKEETMNTSI